MAPQVPRFGDLAPLLKGVSRSFYLSIAALPSGMREPVALAYLLARATDTIADAPGATPSVRLATLDAFAASIRDGTPAPVSDAITSPNPLEQTLLRKAPELVARMEALREADRADVRLVLSRITEGQREDLTRTWPVRDDAELDRYTYLVAGCVGEFWTAIGFRHARRFAALGETEMRALSVRFGKALQLVNILRDIPADVAAGRGYLPGDPAESGPRHLALARGHLAAAAGYLLALRRGRLRYACILPWELARRTLNRVEAAAPWDGGPAVKVPRAEVRRLLAVSALAALSASALRRMVAQ